MDLKLAGEAAVVVGGARGIGRAIAEQFAEEKCQVALVDIDDGVAAAADEIAERYAVKTIGLKVDATDFAALQQAADDVSAKLGRCDHLVSAAAIGSGKYGFPFWNLQPQDWQRVMNVNVLGVVNTMHAFTPAMAAARRGTVLLIASVAAQMGSQTDPPYSASKAAVVNFAQCAAKDLAPFNVRVNSLCPGMVQTELNRQVWNAWNKQQPPQEQRTYEDWADDKVARVTPLARWQTPQDMAEMAVFLASERAANVTGQTINVDGGQVMHS